MNRLTLRFVKTGGLLAAFGLFYLSGCQRDTHVSASRPDAAVAADSTPAQGEERTTAAVNEGDERRAARSQQDTARSIRAQDSDSHEATHEAAPDSKSDSTVGKSPTARLPFVQVLERVDSGKVVTLDGRAVTLNALDLHTDNVRKIQIKRDASNLSMRGSIAIHIDGQGIEWTPRWRTLELTRSSDGAWSATGGELANP